MEKQEACFLVVSIHVTQRKMLTQIAKHDDCVNQHQDLEMNL